ncbi:MAG TPA: outer membrane protein assembly factor BamD [Verrucomicrobiae bacterium]|nr:outer membrane protein assembly factor BamD [Verrucomicrobiae bacterium]
MHGTFAKTRHLLIAALGLSLAGGMCTAAHGQKKVHVTKVKPKKTTKKADTTESAEPDKVLYERATSSIKHSRYLEARLDLQTLINTYPDSEYLAKAKLAIADSYYKEGGTSNLTQSVDEYKNFIVFFPFLDEAAYAQMQVGMAHYRMMEKADRDNSQAESAEDEFRTFLLKYPQSPLVPRAEQYLRDTQEVLADGEFRIAHFYYVKQDYRAAAARLVEVSSRYPLYSQSDLALSMLGNIYMRAKQISRNEDDKNHWGGLAGECYARIVRDYPLSKLAPEAKEKLASMGMQVPKPDAEALARMQKQQEFEKGHHPNVVMKLPMGMIRSSPDISTAAQVGQPNLNPPDDTVSATEVLNQGAAGPSFRLSAKSLSGGSEAQPVDTESVDTSSSAPTTDAGAQVLEAPGATGTATSQAAGASPLTQLPSNAPESNAPAASVAPVESSAAPAATPDQPAAAAQAVATPTTSGSQSSSQASGQSASSKEDPKNESSSKKKKGLHRLIP